ncbi:glycosyltransferase family 2 protein [Paenibacillus yanchengensis]|uniref:Glycosyltransferase family 2 protein n=1 Tax=Paenibacillus yanchengensis TaxID=2035833 RepID=A0ABW4YMV4_9BACL
MSKETAVVICNWNKKTDLMLCIHSVFRSNYTNFDVIVVDNASTDGSVEAIEELAYPIHIIELADNIGGAGGFNAGIEKALEGAYEYIVLLDNDVIVDSIAINNMINIMKDNSNIGLLGAKIIASGTENILQEFGSYIDWDQFNIRPMNKGSLDTQDLPLLLECDYVPACALIARASAVRKVGLMDSQYFIYWDDIEWGYRMKQSGYKVMVTSKAKVWHKMGATERKTTFATYYFWRNRFHFFLEYIEQSQLDQFIDCIFNDLHKAIYFSKHNYRWSVIKSLVYAFEDALVGIRGKAQCDRIFEIEGITDRLAEWMDQSSPGNVIIKNYGSNKSVYQKVISRLTETGKYQVEETEPINHNDNYHICISDHILDIGQEILNYKYDLFIDSFNNIAHTEADRIYFMNYLQSLESSREWMFEYIERRVMQLNRGQYIR